MFSTRSRVSRTAAVTFALAGALGLSACQESGPDAAPPTSAAATSAAEETSAPAETSEESSSSEAPETSESSSESSESPESSSSESSGGDAGDTTLTPEGTTLKFGQPANVVESSTGDSSADGYRLQVDGLEKAPDSVYGGQITKSNGPVYFLRYTVTNTGKSKGSSFDAGQVNSFMLIPNISAGQQGKKIIGSPSGCESDSKELAVGESGKGCDAYQVSGSDITEVVWKPGKVTWSK